MKSIKKINEVGVDYKLGVLISAKKYWYRRPNFKKITRLLLIYSSDLKNEQIEQSF